MAQKIVRLRISGRVQGVGFRAFVADEAEARGLTGWVRNRADHRVEAVLAGGDRIVDEMVEICRRGPPGAKVERLEREDTGENQLAGRAGFEILRTL
ncbi:MAG: acylphosphatase [Methylobacteriaceae bacterium]|jgi:acylphosphatase|nr:acylphosphatase [Methylobacteriaceae bacterium]